MLEPLNRLKDSLQMKLYDKTDGVDMIREVSLEEISDGKLYSANDMVKADCNGCKDCFACCKGMGSSIILDPMDIYRLTAGLNVTFEVLMGLSLLLPDIKK